MTGHLWLYFTGDKTLFGKLFRKKPDYNPDYDLKIEESLTKNEYPTEKMLAARAAEHISLCAQMCTPEVWGKYKDVVSSGPAKWTLA